MDEPKPCPFCGHPPKAWNWDVTDELSCENELCPARPSVEGSSLEDTIALWNTRHIDIGDIGKMSMEALLKAQQERSNG